MNNANNDALYGHATLDTETGHNPTAHEETFDHDVIQSELAGYKDACLRLAADFDNFRKRTQRESEQRAASENEALIRELLPILDNLERALASDRSEGSAPLHQGVEMTLQLLGRLLKSHGVEAVDELGQLFDPHRHEALSVENDSTQPDDTILYIAQRGYTRRGHVFRPAKVIVNDLSHTSEISRGR